MTKTFVFILVVLGLAAVSEACFPSKYWISCLINTCKLGGSCPGDPTATCRMDKTDCDGCHAVWYTQEGKKANCSAHRDLQLCPGGEPVVHCKVDPCQWSCDHPNFRNAPCQKKFCGKCVAEYLVDGIWSQCPSTSPSDSGSNIPIDTVLNPQSVVGNCRLVPCSIEVCINQRCPAVKAAVCRPYACNECRPMWYLGNKPVDCQTGDFIQNLPQVQQPIVRPLGSPLEPFQRTCKPGESHVPCDNTVCEGQICRNYPNAVCRYDGCGTCKARWYLEDKLVDCLSDQCPPNVPFVRCVDDPCKYFSHYCPTAECKASQCGKCEAKFYVNGNEIDCVMPPKACPMGVDPQVCPWYTCPANICPSNSRLMCRIDPCGNQCTHEWIDIYNGEIRTCRTFEREQQPQSPTKQTTFKQPESNRVFFKDPILDIIDPNYSDAPLYVDRKSSFKVKPKEVIAASRVPRNSLPSLNTQPVATQHNTGGFRVDPVFINPGPPIRDTDILSLLRSFPHEVSVVSSAAIKKALKKPMPKMNEPVIPPTKQIGGMPSQVAAPVPKQQTHFMKPNSGLRMVPKPQSSVAVQHTNQAMNAKPVTSFEPKLAPEIPVSMATGVSPDVNAAIIPQDSIQATQQETQFMFPSPVENMPMPQVGLKPINKVHEPQLQKVIELKPNAPISPQPKEPLIQPMDASLSSTKTVEQALALLSEISQQSGSIDLGQTLNNMAANEATSGSSQSAAPLYPEMQTMSQVSNGAMEQPMPQPKQKPKQMPTQNQNNGGLPISMNLFSQWSNSPL